MASRTTLRCHPIATKSMETRKAAVVGFGRDNSECRMQRRTEAVVRMCVSRGVSLVGGGQGNGGGGGDFRLLRSAQVREIRRNEGEGENSRRK